jgi:TolA-binding protein
LLQLEPSKGGLVMRQWQRKWSLAAMILAVAAAVVLQAGPAPSAPPADVGLQAQVTQLQIQVATLQQQVTQLQNSKVNKLEPYVKVIPEAINGLQGPHVIFEGANVHVRSGSGATNDYYNLNDGVFSGLGNLVVGYNEDRPDPTPRTGSHNIVVGCYHSYTKHSGLVAGSMNTISGAGASVAGGTYNTANGLFASVTGGNNNNASGSYSSVTGGVSNTASAQNTSVTGGAHNTANETSSSVTGGLYNTASGFCASVTGGSYNTASVSSSSVTGGKENTAGGMAASVSGGYQNTASGQYSWVGGYTDNTITEAYGYFPQ